MVTVELTGVGVRYGRRTVLSGVTTPVFAGGSVTAVIGPNAAGKSSLFKRIAGLLRGPGTVRVDGTRKTRDAVCYMPQDTAANAVLTVYESVLLARKQGSAWAVSDADLELIDRVIATLGIRDIAFRGLGELSGGQRQLAAIAQTLVRDPEVLLMDEPTSALDLHRQVEVLSFMREVARDRRIAVFVALHDVNHALRFCDHTMVISDGTMVACGPSRDVITVDLLRDVYKVEARIEPCSRDLAHVIVDGPAERRASAA